MFTYRIVELYFAVQTESYIIISITKCCRNSHHNIIRPDLEKNSFKFGGEISYLTVGPKTHNRPTDGKRRGAGSIPIIHLGYTVKGVGLPTCTAEYRIQRVSFAHSPLRRHTSIAHCRMYTQPGPKSNQTPGWRRAAPHRSYWVQMSLFRRLAARQLCKVETKPILKYACAFDGCHRLRCYAGLLYVCSEGPVQLT